MFFKSNTSEYSYLEVFGTYNFGFTIQISMFSVKKERIKEQGRNSFVLMPRGIGYIVSYL